MRWDRSQQCKPCRSWHKRYQRTPAFFKPKYKIKNVQDRSPMKHGGTLMTISISNLSFYHVSAGISFFSLVYAKYLLIPFKSYGNANRFQNPQPCSVNHDSKSRSRASLHCSMVSYYLAQYGSDSLVNGHLDRSMVN